MSFSSRRWQKLMLWTVSICAILLGSHQLLARPDKHSPLANLKLSPFSTLNDATDLSGITFDTRDNTLYAISNAPEIYQLDKNGKLLRRITLRGFHDTEDIVYLKDNQFAVVEERQREIVFIEIDADTTTIDYQGNRKKSLDTTSINTSLVKNRGLEGITRDTSSGLLVAHESNPLKVGTATRTYDNKFIISNHFQPRGADVAGIHYWEDQQGLLVLSEASRTIFWYDKNQQPAGQYPLSYDRLGMLARIDQPEGITTDQQGRIYIVGEPNQIFVLQ